MPPPYGRHFSLGWHAALGSYPLEMQPPTRFLGDFAGLREDGFDLSTDRLYN